MIKRLYETLKSLPKSPKSVITTCHLHINTRNKSLISNPAVDFILDEYEDLQSSNRVCNPIPTQIATKTGESADPVFSSIKISNQWPEWLGLMEKLLKYGYFDGANDPFRSGHLIDGKSGNRIRTACLTFARDRPDLMSHFMDRDIEMIAGSSCPNIDRKVVNSGKRLRAHLGIDEVNVCSSCNLRGNCERAYVKAHEAPGCQTVDVMRFVLTYGLDHNKPFTNKRLEESIISLIKDMVRFSKNKLGTDLSKRVTPLSSPSQHQQEHQSTNPTIDGDWYCSRCKFLNFTRNNKCMRCNEVFHERRPRSRNNKDHVWLKGDWLCVRCKFFNFAKNTRCLQCHTNPPKRQLNPGEWECDSCNYINFRKNSICLKCDHKRPKAFNNSTQLQR